jgi:hypothetical protein
MKQAFSGNYQDFAGIRAISRRFSATAEIDALMGLREWASRAFRICVSDGGPSLESGDPQVNGFLPLDASVDATDARCGQVNVRDVPARRHHIARSTSLAI